KKGDFSDPAVMAQEFGITKRRAEAILSLYGDTLNSLKEGDELVLPTIGIIRCTDGNFHFVKTEKPT
ncbi:MAG: hypothetical protein QHJ82_17625, partial [Verrucomicrobiota bacterium]|nr:hypothetical protein [Verrucomicrobiota bacterium]